MERRDPKKVFYVKTTMPLYQVSNKFHLKENTKVSFSTEIAHCPCVLLEWILIKIMVLNRKLN